MSAARPMSAAARRKWAQEQMALAARWSEVPVGTRVNVKLDDGSIMDSKTRSEPWLLGHGAAVILIEAVTGGYLLDRIKLANANCATCEGKGFTWGRVSSPYQEPARIPCSVCAKDTSR